MKKYECTTRYGKMKEKMALVVTNQSGVLSVSPKFIKNVWTPSVTNQLQIIHITKVSIAHHGFGSLLVKSSPSTLKYLSSLDVIPLAEFIKNGSRKYAKNTTIPTAIFKESLMSVRKPHKAIIVEPSKAESKIRFLSVDIKLAMISSQFIRWFAGLIIPQKAILWLVLSLFSLFFTIENSFAGTGHDTCQEVVTKYERIYRIPQGLLASIAQVESKLNPYALNDGERGYFFANQALVLEKAKDLIRQKHYSFDVGCMQLNYAWHGKYFSTIEEMLDINANIRYAAGLLLGLYNTHGSWQKAVRFYHSSVASHHKPYSRKVMVAWMRGM
jgi:hypothetical protein